jgi:hypothetical protein
MTSSGIEPVTFRLVAYTSLDGYALNNLNEYNYCVLDIILRPGFLIKMQYLGDWVVSEIRRAVPFMPFS